MKTVTAVIGMGYVGLPLVVAFGNHSRTIGFDIRARKAAACQAGTAWSRELSPVGWSGNSNNCAQGSGHAKTCRRECRVPFEFTLSTPTYELRPAPGCHGRPGYRH